MTSRKLKLSKFSLAMAISFFLNITCQPVFAQNIEQLLQQGYDAGNAGKVDEAEAIFRKVIEIAPNTAEAYFYLGAIFQEQGQFDAAIENYQQAIQLNPNLADAYMSLGAIQNINYPMM